MARIGLFLHEQPSKSQVAELRRGAARYDRQPLEGGEYYSYLRAHIPAQNRVHLLERKVSDGVSPKWVR